MNDKIKESVVNIIVDQLGCPRDKVVDDANIIDDLGADSLDFVEMMMTLEEEFGICITEEEAESLDTVGKIVKFVDEEQSSRRPSI